MILHRVPCHLLYGQCREKSEGKTFEAEIREAIGLAIGAACCALTMAATTCLGGGSLNWIHVPPGT